MRLSRKRAIARVFRALEEAEGWIWIREIARRTRMHPEQVRRVLDNYFQEAIDEIELPVRLRVVRLKEGVTLKGHLRYLKLTKRL
jgi:methylphosphotriester-DNA--protein-cysteine methyltransferase